MKKIIYLFLIGTVLLSSCSKEENVNQKSFVLEKEVKSNSLNHSCSSNPKAYRSSIERELSINYFNSLFKDDNYIKLKSSIKNGMNINNVESIKSNIEDNIFDKGLFNDYLRLRGKQEIDVNEYFNEGKIILSDTSSNVDDFVKYLKKYNIYSEEMLELFVQFDKEISNCDSERDFANAIKQFNKNIKNSKLALFDKNTMKLYSLIIEGFMGSDQFKQDFLQNRDDCSKCLRRHRWRIVGWGAFWLLIAIIACIAAALGGPAAVIACIIAVAGAFILWRIQLYCGKYCSWI